MPVKTGTKRSQRDGNSHILVAADVHELLRGVAYREHRPISEIASDILRTNLSNPPRRTHAASA